MKSRSSFICQQCGYHSPSWMGKCPECGSWNSLVETVEESQKSKVKSQKLGEKASPQKLTEVTTVNTKRIATGFSEFDRVLGGGIVPGSVVLVAGDPGIGKSTLLLQTIGNVGGLYISGEESAHQIKLRADRLKISPEKVSVLADNNLDSIIGHLSNLSDLGLVIIDSIQTIESEELSGMAGSVGQIRECSGQLIQLAKARNTPMFIVGHVTKEGTIAGPKVLEHMVDVVCYVEGERYHQGRIVRSFKNRFGPTDEVGIFEMKDIGLAQVTNPSQLFLEGRIATVAGSAIAVTMEGTRPLLVEIQSLTVSTQLAMPRRVANGINYNRLQVILAILQKRLGLPLGGVDVYVNVSGGLKLSEPAVDLPVALSIISAFNNKPLPATLASFGELGLLGELRQVVAGKQRIAEAKRLGFTSIVGPHTTNLLTQLVKKVF